MSRSATHRSTQRSKSSSKSARLNVRNCICGRRPELNTAATAGHHPDRFELKAGIICFVIVSLVLYLIDPSWVVWPFVLLVGVSFLAAFVKILRGHSPWCAMRGGLLIGIAGFANVLEALNPGNWI